MGKRVGLCGAVVLVTAVMTPTVGRAAILIDDFADKVPGAWPIVANAPFAFVTTPTEYGLANTLGGKRGGVLYVPGPGSLTVPGFDAIRADVYNDAGYSFLDVDSTVGAGGGFTLFYGDTDNRLGLVYAPDLSVLRIVFLGYDSPGGLPLTASVAVSHVEGSVGGEATAHFSFLGEFEVTTPGAQVLDIPLGDYWSHSAVTLDTLSIGFTGAKGTDFRIDSISLVPEPASAALLAVAAGAMSVRRRRA